MAITRYLRLISTALFLLKRKVCMGVTNQKMLFSEISIPQSIQKTVNKICFCFFLFYLCTSSGVDCSIWPSPNSFFRVNHLTVPVILRKIIYNHQDLLADAKKLRKGSESFFFQKYRVQFSRAQKLIVTCEVVSSPPCRRVADTSWCGSG